jgi:hypothetical protein
LTMEFQIDSTTCDCIETLPGPADICSGNYLEYSKIDAYSLARSQAQG